MRLTHAGSRVSLALIVGSLAIPSPAASQGVTPGPLGRVLARSPDGFTSIGGLHEFGDGRVIAVDFRENRTVLVDFARQASRDLTRPGTGPAELPLVLSVLRWFGDTVLLGGHREALKVSPEAKIVDKVSMPFAALRSFSAPQFADREGRLYGNTQDPLGRNPDGSFVAALGRTVLRTDLRSGRVDSLVRLQLRDPLQPLGNPWRPYPMHDAYAVLPNGDVMVIRALGYSVEVWRDGIKITARPVPGYTPIPIGPAERDAYRDEKARQPAGGGGGSTGATEVSSEAGRSARRRALGIPDEIFPPILPPIIEVNAALVDRDGIVWVARSFRAGSTDRLYDLFDGTGTLVRRVIVRNRGKVVGFGSGVVYVAVPDRDDVLSLEKVAVR